MNNEPQDWMEEIPMHRPQLGEPMGQTARMAWVDESKEFESPDPFKRLASKLFSFVILMCLSLVSITATVAVCWKLAKWAME